MEKLAYVLWRREATPPQHFVDEMRSLAADIRGAERGRTYLNLVDGHVAPMMAARLTRLDPPPSGLLTFWLDACDDRPAIEAALAEHTERVAGYLVVESVPLVNTTRVVARGERTPGVNMIALIEKPARIPYDRWIEHWHGHHKRVALETQCTYAYVRNVVVRELTAGAPPWAGIVEEGFPAEAVTDPMLWYKADGSVDRLQRNMARMIESVQSFLDIDRVESHPMSEYRMSD